MGVAGMSYVCTKILRKQSVTFRDYWTGIRKQTGVVALWALGTVLLWGWCGIAFVFYVAQDPLLAAMGCTIVLTLLAGVTATASLVLPKILQGSGFKHAIYGALRLILERPGKVAGNLVGLLLIEGFLGFTGAGFLVAGATLPVLYSLLFWENAQRSKNGQAPYQEDRTFKDFLVPRVK
jgi:hypothetical protein